MLARNVERKLTIFISSKMDERYYPIRRALKTLLMETGLVTHVYLFEQEASSQNTQDAYLAEVAKSDLCIFLIDNSDGVTDAVYREHKHASSSGVHRLYFFCNEHSNDRVPLQLELEQSGVTIYRPISEFAEIPQIAYERTLQDILDWYQKRDENPENNAGVQAHSIQVGSLLKLGKTVFSHYSSNNILVKTLNPYNEKDISEDNNFSSAFDHLCADFLRMVIGREPFSTDVFLQLSDAILSESSMVTNIVDALRSVGYLVSDEGRVFRYDAPSVQIALIAPKHKLYDRILSPGGVDWRHYLSKQMLPDDALYNLHNNKVYIVEKKFQSSSGSVDEKLQTCHYKKLHYQKMFTWQLEMALCGRRWARG